MHHFDPFNCGPWSWNKLLKEQCFPKSLYSIERANMPVITSHMFVHTLFLPCGPYWKLVFHQICNPLEIKSLLLLLLLLVCNFSQHFIHQNLQKFTASIPKFCWYIICVSKKFGSRMRPHIWWDLILIQIICKCNKSSSNIATNEQRINKYCEKIS